MVTAGLEAWKPFQTGSVITRHSSESGNLMQAGIASITATAIRAEALFAAEAAPTGNPSFQPLICLLDAYQAKRLQCRFDQNYQ
jgi:hypothetical protein